MEDNQIPVWEALEKTKETIAPDTDIAPTVVTSLLNLNVSFYSSLISFPSHLPG